MKEKWIKAYMDVAHRFAQLSSARRLNVGAIIVKDDKIISIGYNGTPAGWDNNCEEEMPDGSLVTKKEVLHGEENAIVKLAKTNGNAQGATMFCTHSPCIHCSKLIHGSGISKVFYKTIYRNDDGIQFLKKCGIDVISIE